MGEDKAPVTPGPVTGEPVTAGLVIIGNEVLSGRTQDTNTAFLAAYPRLALALKAW